MKIDRTRFFAALPKRLCPLKARPDLDGLLTRIEQDDGWVILEQVAYFLATIAHETGFTFRPVKEKRASKARQPELWATQERYWPSGFYGRGYVQITWARNYAKLGRVLADAGHLDGGADSLVENPDLTLFQDVAYWIAAIGMREGLFTTRRLVQYIRSEVYVGGSKVRADYLGARRIINGQDRAEDIAEIANGFEVALLAGSAA